MTSADNQVFDSKEITIAASDNTGADNRLEYISDESH